MDNDDRRVVSELQLDDTQLDFSVFVRYWHTVDHPEMAEYMLLFLEKYFQEGNSRYFSNIRVIPRHTYNRPHECVLDKQWIQLYDVDSDSYEWAMNIYSAWMYMSHSSNIQSFEMPNIISASMESQIEWDIVSNIELEDFYQEDWWTKQDMKNVDLAWLLSETLWSVQKLENLLDSIWSKKV
jgi:hypothetical protein